MIRGLSTPLKALGVLLALAAPVCSHAQTQAFTFTPDPQFDYPASNYNEAGLNFNISTTVAAPFVPVYALGFYDASIADRSRVQGLKESHQVGIFNSTGNLLVQATIQAGTASQLVGNFRYTDQLFNGAGQALNGPLNLTQGSYIIESLSQTDSFIYVLGSASLTPAQGVGYVRSAFGNYPTLTFPDLSSGFHTDRTFGFFGGNFLTTPLNPSAATPAVPEPGAFALLGGSLTALGLTWRRRRVRAR